jgi:DNA-binding response OmpR family regulator
LKKFAPGHAVNLARSLIEAEALARNICPGLIILDFDPAFPGIISFFYRIRDVCPDARVLVIGAGVADEVASEFRSLGAFQFIEKPFEVSDLGAAVQALLGPWTDRESAERRGTLQRFGPADLVLAQCAGNRTALLQVRSGGKSGEIHVVDGQLVHAVAGKRKDAQALDEIFSWLDPQVEEIEKRSSARRTIPAPWTDVFLASARESNRRRALSFPAPAAAPSVKPTAKTGKKLVVIDDTEMLLIFVEDTLAIADPQLQITTAADGLGGVKEVARVMPDLVLLDYNLPDVTGGEVCRRLLANEKTAGIPVLMMSGHVPEMTAAAANFENIVATISKPFLSDALVTLVQQTLSAGVRPASRKIDKQAIKTAAAPSPPESPKAPKQAAPLPITEPAPTPPAPIISKAIEIQRSGVLVAPLVSKDSNEVVLGLFLEVLSMQLTPSLRMGTIRAKVSSSTVSLHVSPAALRATLPVETGFELGPVEMDANGRIATIRVVPTLRPFQRLQTRNALQIGGLAVVPHNSREHMQLTPTQNAPMMMHLLAHLELAGVELSDGFQLARLVLKSRSTTVRVTLSSEAVGQEQTGVFCETAGVQLDASGRLAELLLNPLK